MIGSRLKLAREAAGLSLRDLQDRINGLVSAQAIGKYERDEMMPSSSVLLAMAKAVGVSPEYLLSKRDVALTEIDFRRHTAAGEKEQRAVQAMVLDYAERYMQIESLLPGVATSWDPPEAREFHVRSIEDAEGAAEKLRGLWKLGIGPINSLMELLEDKGIKVVEIPMSEMVSGSKAFAKQGDLRPSALIVVNANHNSERQRFTLAHELGHLVLQFNDQLPEKQQERAADRFAGAFLMTQELLKKLLGTNRHAITMGELLSLKKFFKVSIAALVVRCGQLGILTKAAYGRAFGWLKANGLADVGAAEPDPLPRETPMRMKRLCLRGIAEGAISESKAISLLRISRKALEHELEFQAA
jgi:Zn-dependent peptidase ImmA (M78 family)/transcriptional regulator with XRE-family HTH domain